MADCTGVRAGDTFISYKSIAQDVVDSVNWVHTEGSTKRHVLENVDRYVVKDERIKQLLPQLRQNGAQT